MMPNRQKRLTREDVLASDVVTDSFSEDETSSESLAENFLDEDGNVYFLYCQPLVFVLFQIHFSETVF